MSRETKIEPASFQRNDTSKSSSKQGGSKPPRIPVGFLLFLVASIFAAGVFFLLPKWVNPKDPAAEKPPAATEKPSPEVAPKPREQISPETLMQKAGARMAQRQWEEKRSHWQNLRVTEWAKEKIAPIDAIASNALEHLEASQYILSSNTFEKATQALPALSNGIPVAVSQALNAGRKALAEGNQTRAVSQFELVLLLEPQNTFASVSLERAKVLDQVIALINRASNHEKQQNLPLALADYQEALALDERNNTARSGLNRVRNQLKEERIMALMSEGLQALNQKDFERAILRLDEAASLNPQDERVRDLLDQAKQEKWVKEANELLAEARVYEQEDAWEQASLVYEKILSKDPSHDAARTGNTRSKKILTLRNALQVYLDKPEKLIPPEGFKYAASLVHESSPLLDLSPSLKTVAQKVDQELTTRSKPVSLKLTSDGKSDILILKMAQLGSFEHKTMQLKPGEYILLAQRNGFRDVRKTIQLKPGQDLSLDIRCTEPF